MAECQFFKEARLQTRELCDFRFLSYAQESPDPLSDRCRQLKEIHVHGQGPWVHECGCSSGQPFGVKAPLLRDAFFVKEKDSLELTREELTTTLVDQLKWFDLDPASVPGGSDSDAAVPAATAAVRAQARRLLTENIRNPENEIEDWQMYMKRRQLPRDSPFPLVLDSVMTIYKAIHEWRSNLYSTGVKAPTKMTIVLAGAEKELDQWPLLVELCALLPADKADHILLHICGTELPSWADKKIIRIMDEVIGGSSASGSGSADANENQNKNMRERMQIVLHAAPLEELLMDRCFRTPPDLVVALNSGIAAYKSWAPGVSSIFSTIERCGKPTMFFITDKMYMMNVTMNTVLHCAVSVYNGSMSGTLEQKEAHHVGRYNVKVLDPTPNPFRNPRWILPPYHDVPHFNNGFISIFVPYT